MCPDNLKPCGVTGRFTPPTTPTAPTPTPGTPAVTITDIATFRPTPPAPGSEPNGWGIAGLDTNFVSSASAQTVTGTLLGRPAAVRFTPAGYLWSYGDGATRTTASAGTWQTSGSREFDPTPSSHVYAKPGDYTAQLSVVYTAEYSWGDAAGFVPIDGLVTVPAGEIPMHIVVESTVLVGSGCAPGSTAPGC